MPIQADPPFIDSVKAQAFRARLRAIYNAPAAIPPQRFNVQQPLPPVPYTNSPNFSPYLDAQIKANPAPQPPTRIAPLLPPSITPITPPPTTNPVPKIAPPSGGGAAAIVTTAGGVITGAGVLTGGLSLFAGGVLVYNARELYKLFKLSQPEPKAIFQEPPDEGQEAGVGYGFSSSSPFHNQSFPTAKKLQPNLSQQDPLWGPVTQFNQTPHRGRFDDWYVTVRCAISKIDQTQITREIVCGLRSEPSPTIGNLERFEDELNTNPSPLKVPIPKRSPIKSGITPSPTPQSISNPNPNGLRSPTSPPGPTADPLATNNRIPYTITTPGANPITITSPGAAPITISPASSPATIKITRPSASPFLSPSPGSTPRTTPTGDPIATPAGVPIAVSSPGSEPIDLVMPGTSPITITYPGQAPIVIDPTGFKLPQGVQAAPIPKPGAFLTTPAALPQTPTNPVTTPATPTKPVTPTTPTIPGVEEPDVKDILLKLVALTGLIQGVNKNTTPAAIQNAVGPAITPAVCSTTAPGGCSSNMTNSAVGKGVDDLKDFLKKNGIDGLAQAEQLRLLNQLDGKMGAQLPGGVAGAFGRLSNFLGIDRIFNLINFMANLHNAFMLSNSLKITLLEMLSSVGNATGLLQSSEGENVDLNAVYDKGVRALINSILGDEQAARLEIQFRRANRIYQAAANSTNAVSSMMSSLGNVVEVSAEYGGKIGNALKAAGAVHEKAYQWMAEKFDAKVSPFMKYSQTVNGVGTALETINEIAESVVEGQQAATEFQKANTDFLNAVAEVKKNPGIENKAVAEQVAKQKENATKDPTGEDETGLLSFLTDL